MDVPFHLLLLLIQLTLQANCEFLFRTSPGGDGYRSAGLWGGSLNLDNEGQGSNLYSYGYDSLNTSYKTFYGIEMEYISFDPITNRVLMIVDEPDGSSTSTKHSMALGPLCKEGCTQLEATFQNFKLTDDNHPYLMDQDCGFKCGWGPFAFYNDRVYFVLSAIFGDRYGSLYRHIEIRQLEGCEDIIESIKINGGSGTVSDFPVLQCSNIVNILYQEEYIKPNSRPKVWVAKDLKIITGQDNFHFFLQYIDTSTAAPELKLIHSLGHNVHILHSETVSAVFAGKIKVRGLGSIDYKDGYLCWSATEKLYCTVYDLGGVLEVPGTMILDGRDAMQRDICNTGNLPQEEFQRSLTGVAISDTHDTLSVYFGCYADIPATGGTGLIRLSNHGLTKKIYQVKSSSHRVYGGNLFIAQTVDIGCDYFAAAEVDLSSSTGSNANGKSSTYTTKSDVSSDNGGVICEHLQPSTSDGNKVELSTLLFTCVTLFYYI